MSPNLLSRSSNAISLTSAVAQISFQLTCLSVPIAQQYGTANKSLRKKPPRIVVMTVSCILFMKGLQLVNGSVFRLALDSSASATRDMCAAVTCPMTHSQAVGTTPEFY